MAERSSKAPKTVPSTTTKWRSVRPWRPPGSLVESSPEANTSPISAISDTRGRSASGRLPANEMNLEVVDVSCTAVSIAVFGPSNASPSNPSSSTSSPASAEESTAPNLSIKLNSAPWPHVYHTDAASFEMDHHSNGQRQVPSARDGETGATIVIFGLSPGKQYNIELGVIEQPPSNKPSPAALPDAEELITDQDLPSALASATVTTAPSAALRDAAESPLPDDAPPPYSPRTDDDASALEASLKEALASLRASNKASESSLQSSLAALKKSVDKASREDQRLRQKIRLLEDSTARFKEVAEEEITSTSSILDSVKVSNVSEEELVHMLERKKSALAEIEKLGKEESDTEEARIEKLREELEKITRREEAIVAERHRCEREILPAYNIRLATLEADLRRLAEDARRQQHYAQAQAAHAYYYPAANMVPVNKAGNPNRYSANMRNQFQSTQMAQRQHHADEARMRHFSHPGGSVLTQSPQMESYPTYTDGTSLFSNSPPATGFLSSLHEDSTARSAQQSPNPSNYNTTPPISAMMTGMPPGLRKRSTSLKQGSGDDNMESANSSHSGGGGSSAWNRPTWATMVTQGRT